MHRTFAQLFHTTTKNFERHYNKLEPLFFKGITSERHIWQTLSKRLRAKPQPKLSFYSVFRDCYSPKTGMFALAAHLRRHGYKIGLLSNIEKPALKHVVRQNYAVFHAAVFSCRAGFAKPEAPVYRTMLHKLRLKPHETVFIDNKIENVNGARRVGMKAILFKNVKQTTRQLHALLRKR